MLATHAVTVQAAAHAACRRDAGNVVEVMREVVT